MIDREIEAIEREYTTDRARLSSPDEIALQVRKPLRHLTMVKLGWTFGRVHE